MRFYIMFGVTIILALIIYFYNPNSKFLGVYDEDVCIEYNYDNDGYHWVYESDDNIIVKKEGTSKWILSAKANGEYNINFYYTNDEDISNSLYQINYTFKFKDNKIYWTYGEGFGLLSFPDPY